MRTSISFGALAAVILTILFATTGAHAGDKLENIKVLPKDMTKQEVEAVMQVWSRSLGVKCTFCHEMKVPGDWKSMDFASDKVDEKETTRRMVKMVEQLNAGPLPKAAGEKGVTVSCVTCHRGLAHPDTLDQVVLREVKKKGAKAGIKKYKDLKGKYYGRGSYDLGSESLSPAIRKLAEDPKGLDSALALANLDVENFPKEADARVMKAQILLMKGDKKGAKKAVDEALSIDPKNRHALRMKKGLGR
jgi:hypothetical protein